MSKDLFSKWDANIDVEGLAKDVKEAAENGGGSFKEVPHGKYEVAVNQMELKASSKGDPMVTIWFKIISEGEYKGSMIFMNQVVTQGFQIHIVDEMLRALTEECDDAPTIEFKNYKQYNDLIMDVFEAIDGKFEYALDYAKGKGDFSKYKIDEVYVLE